VPLVLKIKYEIPAFAGMTEVVRRDDKESDRADKGIYNFQV